MPDAAGHQDDIAESGAAPEVIDVDQHFAHVAALSAHAGRRALAGGTAARQAGQRVGRRRGQDHTSRHGYLELK